MNGCELQESEPNVAPATEQIEWWHWPLFIALLVVVCGGSLLLLAGIGRGVSKL